ncbi:hypothetical protein OHA21_43670 [Actinoplanes sp. NBC_00393]|uniref:hypothetical protein n=1 Tax=Actinoplanes sp. NBC_00393 TaxID=2975953 RepID=UPI002E1E3E67
MAELLHVTTKYVFDVTGKPVLGTTTREQFDPETAIVSHRTDRGFWSLRVHGWRVRNNTSTAFFYRIADGVIQPHDRTGSVAPQWLQHVVGQAVKLHAERVGDAR